MLYIRRTNPHGDLSPGESADWASKHVCVPALVINSLFPAPPQTSLWLCRHCPWFTCFQSLQWRNWPSTTSPCWGWACDGPNTLHGASHTTAETGCVLPAPATGEAVSPNQVCTESE
jgi:hypothetical protein